MTLALKLAALSGFNIILTFLFQWYLLTNLGPSWETDALFAGMTIPQLVLAVTTGSLMHVLVPLLAGDNDRNFRVDAWSFLFLVGGLFTVGAGVLYYYADIWVPFTVPGFDEASKSLAITLTRVQLIGMVFISINSVQWAVYHAQSKFLWAEATPLLASVAALAILAWALPRYGIIAAAWASTIRFGFQTVLLAPGMGRPLKPNFKSPAIKLGWLRLRPLLLGTSYYKTDQFLDRFLLSSAPHGGISLYNLAQQIYGAIGQVLNKSLVAPLVPQLSYLHKISDKRPFLRLYNKKIYQIIAICILFILIFLFSGERILSLIVGHGNFSEANITELWWLMIWLSGLLIGSVAGQIASSAFYSIGDTRTPTIVSVITYTLYVPIKIMAFYWFGIIGLAGVTSVYYIANLIIQFLLFKNAYRPFPDVQ